MVHNCKNIRIIPNLLFIPTKSPKIHMESLNFCWDNRSCLNIETRCCPSLFLGMPANWKIWLELYVLFIATQAKNNQYYVSTKNPFQRMRDHIAFICFSNSYNTLFKDKTKKIVFIFYLHMNKIHVHYASSIGLKIIQVKYEKCAKIWRCNQIYNLNMVSKSQMIEIYSCFRITLSIFTIDSKLLWFFIKLNLQ